jgi:prepilin-type N-terminal cleavage/methylation domain-containing protein
MRGVLDRRDEGFSLVELMTVVAILGILVTVAIASFYLTRERSLAVTCRHDQRVIMDSITQYQAENMGSVPDDLDELDPAFAKQSKGFGHCPLDGVAYTYSRLTMDTYDFACPNHEF